jgi:exonuclease III
MRILSWNCNGAFRRKFRLLDNFEADILVIQECEEPTESFDGYFAWAGNYLWVGAHKHKGLGIFAKGDLRLQRLNWPAKDASLFLPVQINNGVQIVGVWTQAVKNTSASYVGQLWQYLQLNRERLNETTVLCGDFNSNTQWDKPRGQWSHSKCVAELSELRIVSIYHRQENEPQGDEKRPTFFLQRNLSKPFHIDYAFAHENLTSQVVPNFMIGDPDPWLAHSDHMPLVFDI